MSWWHHRDGAVMFRMETGHVEASVLRDGIVRLRWSADGNYAPERSWSPIPMLEARPRETLTVGTSGREARLTSESGLMAEVLEAGRLRVLSPNHEILLDASLTDRPTWSAAMPKDHCYFGAGERTGLLERRGRRYTCWATDVFEGHGPYTDAMHVAVPWLLMLAPNGHCSGLFLNTTWRSWFDLTDIVHESMEIGSDADDLDLFVVDGPGPADVLKRYAQLTGATTLPPRWSLGFIQARWSYRTQAEVLDVASEFRRRSIPVDAIGIDIDHMDGYRVFTWDSERFPDPKDLTERLAEIGVHATAIVDCAIKSDEPGRYRVYDEAVERGYLLRTQDGREFSAHVWPGKAALPDFAREDVRKWWGSWHRTLVDAGIDGVLNDMNEPALKDRPIDDPEARRVELPENVEHGVGEERTTHAEVHNVYGTLQTIACVDGLAAARPDHRSLVLTRSGFAGVQRHAGIWTGDNFSSWEHLEMSLPQLVNLGLSGIPFCGADIGGFFGHCTPELMIRWMQLAAFYPLMRANNAENCSPQEPWVWGPDTEAAIRSAIELRYRLLPYLYSALADSSRSGAPVLRPMWWSEPCDRTTRLISDQAFVGDSMMIAPVVRPGLQCRAVLLPAGRWFDWRTDQSLSGHQTVVTSAHIDEGCPIFVRAGTVLPMGPVVQYADQSSSEPLDLHVFPDEDGTASGSLYEDDGVTFAYQRGAFRLTHFRFSGGELSQEHEGAALPELRSRVIVHTISD